MNDISVNQTGGDVICQRLDALRQRFAKRGETQAAAGADEILNRMMHAFIKESYKLADNYFSLDEPRLAGRTYINKAEGQEALSAIRMYGEAAVPLEEILQWIEIKTTDTKNSLSALFSRTINRDYQDIHEVREMILNSWADAMRNLNRLQRPSGPKLAFSAAPPEQHAP